MWRRRSVCHRRVHPASPDETEAAKFFNVAARERAGGRVRRIAVLSIIGSDRFTAGYGAAKVVDEEAMLLGPIPAGVQRSQRSQVGGRRTCQRGETSRVPPW